MADRMKVEVELTNPRTLGSLQSDLERLKVLGAPATASIRVTGGYPGAEEYYTAEASWVASEGEAKP